jgi:hypothetical protein
MIFAPQRDGGLDPGRAACRDPGCEQRGGGDGDGDRGEQQRLVELLAIEQPVQRAGEDLLEPDRQGQPDRDAGGDQGRCLSQHHRAHLARLRAQGDPQPDLVGALRDGVRHHAVDPDRGEQQRQCAERGQQEGQEPRPRDRLPQDLVHRADLEHRQRGIQAGDRALHRRNQRRRIARGAQQRVHRGARAGRNGDRRVLRERNEHLGAGGLVQPGLLEIGDHADDRLDLAGRRRSQAPDGDLLAERILVRKELGGERLVDHDDRGRALDVSARDAAAAHDPRAERFQRAVTHDLPVVDVPRWVVGAPGPVDELEVVGVDRPAREHPAEQRRVGDAGQRPHPLEVAAPELIALDAGVGLLGELDAEGQHVVGLEAQLDVLEPDEAAHHRGAADHQHHRQRDLGDHQRAAHP